MNASTPLHVIDTALDTVERVDVAVSTAAATRRDHPMVRLAGQLSEIGDQPPLRALSLGALALGLYRHDRRLVRAGVRMIVAHTVATAVKSAIKGRIDRTRPDRAIDKSYRMERGDSDEHDLSSFPSGHTAGALAVTQALARDYPGSRAAGLAATAIVAAVQVPRAKHFIGDIVAGAAIGWAAEQLTSRALDAAERALLTSDN